MVYGRNLCLPAMAAAIAAAIVVLTASGAEDTVYTGNASCKICHNKKDTGEQWIKWKAGPHAKAFETLRGEEAGEIVRAKNIEKPAAEAPECLRCHVTGVDTATGKAPKKINPVHGVQCESCHGPAALHFSEARKQMSGDKNAKPEQSIVRPNVDTCEKCHNKESITWNPDRYTRLDGSKTGFDFEQARNLIRHDNPRKIK